MKTMFQKEREEMNSIEAPSGFCSGAVIMASGLGKRFGGNKLMADFGGEPMIRRVLLATEGLFFSRVAVTRNEETAAYLRGQGVDTILHDLPGRNDTVRLGFQKVMEKEVAGCMILQSDQPLLRRETVQQLLLRAAEEPGKIWRVTAAGEPGSPVWFPKSLFPELLTLPEGKGGRAVIRRHPELLRTMEVEDPLELKDADTPEELEALLAYCSFSV